MGKTNTNWEAVDLFSDRANMEDCKEHFRLKKYDVTLKEIAKVRFGSHCKYNVNYHLVWIPKTRMKILVEPFKSEVKKYLLDICQEFNWSPLALEIMVDHLHFFLSAHPKWSPMKIVKELKQESSKRLRAKYSCIRDTRDTDDFWATGYYCGTAGHVSADQVARYILEQTNKLKGNWNLFDIQPFEYNINDGKIPDKAQKTLDAFGIGGFNSALHNI
jgi:putative transposase